MLSSKFSTEDETSLVLPLTCSAAAERGRLHSETREVDRGPWEDPIFIIMQSVTGPLGRSITAIAIAVAGFSWLFGGHERGMRNVLGLAIGIALTLGAVQVMDALGFGGAIL